MANATQAYKRSLSGSVGAGMGSLFNGGGKTYFILEHKVSSKYHKAGEVQEIIVDQVELGRSPECAVRFDESFSTVSRRHAAIVRDGANWKLVQLSTTNTTFLNGHPVQKEWYLQNGDEIQLAVNGPKLGFLIPTGKKSTVGSIGLSRRLSLFRQQALRPYRTAMYVMGCIILVMALGGGWKLYDLHTENQALDAKYAQARKDIDRQDAINDSLANELVKSGKSISELESELKKVKKGNGRSNGGRVRPITNDDLKDCDPYIYYITTVGFVVTAPSGERVELTAGDMVDDVEIHGWSGTGFMLENGKFVTARHVAQGWYFPITGDGVSDQDMLFNMVASNGGKVVAHFIACSSSGATLEFTSDDFIVNSRNDEVREADGYKVVIADYTKDFAYINTGRKKGLKFDSDASTHLERGTQLTVLGFPMSIGANAIDDINPILGSATVAANGLEKGRIVTTDTNYEHGNSGGPVLLPSGNRLKVVGIVSASKGQHTGFIIPISYIN